MLYTKGKYTEKRRSNNIDVYLTKSQNETKGLSERVMVAKQYHADLLVSQHINDSESSSPNGASVMISRGTYRPKLAAQEKLFGSYVVEELKKLGLRIRFPETKGMEYRMSESGSKYPNGNEIIMGLLHRVWRQIFRE